MRDSIPFNRTVKPGGWRLQKQNWNHEEPSASEIVPHRRRDPAVAGVRCPLTGMIGKPKPIPPEKIVSAERGDIARSVVARGKIEPLSKVEVKSKANGIIKALLVDVGDQVTEGQILAELDKEDLEAQVREAKATRDGEEANLARGHRGRSQSKIEAANPELEFTRRDFVRASGAVQTEDRFAATTRRRQPRSRGVQEPPAIAGCHRANGRRPGGRGSRPGGGGKSGPGSGGRDSQLCHDSAPIAGIVLTRNTELGDAVSSILNMGSAATLIMTLGRHQQCVYQRRSGRGGHRQG